MLTEKTAFALRLACAALSGLLLFLARTLSAPLWLVLSLAGLLTVFLYVASDLFPTGSSPSRQRTPDADPFLTYTLLSAALCFLLAAILRVPQFIRDGMIFSFLLIAAPLAASLACGFRLLVGELHRRSGPSSMIPIFSLCAQLLCFYRANSYHPDTEAFGYEIIVLCLLLMGLYLTASGKYKLRTPRKQRFWALLPLAGCAMELCMLLFARGQLYQAEDMNASTLLGMAGAAALLLPPLLFPNRPVAMPKKAAPVNDQAPADAAEGTPPPPAESDPPESDT